MKVSLSWNAVSTAASYNVFRSLVSGDMSPLKIGNTIGTSWIDIPPVPDTYYYVVTGLDADGESLFSTEYPASPLATPSVPSGVTAIITTT